jgi:hypothetical protein
MESEAGARFDFPCCGFETLLVWRRLRSDLLTSQVRLRAI